MDHVDWDADQLVRIAERELRSGQWREAVALLKRALTVDEDHARAHPMLALALLVPGRTSGAEAEARRSLQLDGGSIYGHYAMAAALFARKRTSLAWTYCHVALGGGVDQDTEIEAHLLGARIRQARGETEHARELLDRAVALHPQRLATRIAAARFELAAGNLDLAARHADEALRLAGTDVAANTIAGEIDLRTGDVDAAERHAQFALLQDEQDRDALLLWGRIKQRKQPATGWAWRGFVWLSTRNDVEQTGILVGSYLITELLMILANAAGLPGVQSKLIWVWLGFLVGMYWGPVGLHKLVSRELGTPDRSV